MTDAALTVNHALKVAVMLADGASREEIVNHLDMTVSEVRAAEERLGRVAGRIQREER